MTELGAEMDLESKLLPSPGIPPVLSPVPYYARILSGADKRGRKTWRSRECKDLALVDGGIFLLKRESCATLLRILGSFYITQGAQPGTL